MRTERWASEVAGHRTARKTASKNQFTTGTRLRGFLLFILLHLFAGPSHAQTSAAASPSADVDSLSKLLGNGYALSVSRELARRLSLGSQQATPGLVLLAARAHAAAHLWGSVDRLLADREWLAKYDGEGLLLLARSALAQDHAQAAAEQFERLAAVAETSGVRLTAEVHLDWARAVASLGQARRAADHFEAAAKLATPVPHWLLLSSLQQLATVGDVQRALAVARQIPPGSAVPHDSVWRTVAVAAFQSGDPDLGLRLADSLTSLAAADLAADWLAPALLAHGDSSGARSVLERALRARRGGAAVGDLLLELDSSWESRRRVADADLSEGRFTRAAREFEAVLGQAPDAHLASLALDLARARFGQRNYADAGRILSRWLESAGRSGEHPVVDAQTRSAMWFLLGRSLFRRGQRRAASVAFERTAQIPGARDGAYASFLIADIHHDDGSSEEAAAAYERTVSEYPRSSYAGTALIRLGLMDMVGGRPEAARHRFDGYRRRFPGGNWSQAASFWSATAADAAGRASVARPLYRQVIASDPLSYYAIRSGERLGVDVWDELPRRPCLPVPALAAREQKLVERMNWLRVAGWPSRAKREYRAVRRSIRGRGPLQALAEALNEAGWTWEGSAIGWDLHRAAAGVWTDDLLRLVYPLRTRGLLTGSAATNNLDPALVAAVVRRESNFDPDVVSTANAVGLMQIVPVTGAEMARRMGLPNISTAQLSVPEINLVLGSRYLHELLDRFRGSVVAALISYNAGPHRYIRWREFPEFEACEEMAIDRIPLSETRRYVKAVVSYRYIYRRLYGLEAGPPSSSFPATC